MVLKELSMGVDYIPSMSVSRYEYGLDAGSMGFGMTYETSFGSGKIKWGLSRASKVLIGPPSSHLHPSGTSAYDLGDTVCVRSGDATGLSKAVSVMCFDASVAYAHNQPYNNRKDIFARSKTLPGATQDQYAPASALTLRAGYTAHLTAGADTHFGIRHLRANNVYQVRGDLPGNKSRGSVTDLGVTHRFGGTEFYAGYTKVADATATITTGGLGMTMVGNQQGMALVPSTTSNKTFSGYSGVVLGAGYTW